MAGMFDKLLSDPYRMNLALNSIGLLGSKYQDTTNQYMGRISTGLLDQAKSKAQALRDAEAKRVNDALIGYKQAQKADLENPSMFDGRGGSVQAMNVVSRLGAKLQRREPLTKEEEIAYKTARAYLERDQVVMTQQGPQQMSPMDLGFLDAGAQPMPAPSTAPSTGPMAPQVPGAGVPGAPGAPGAQVPITPAQPPISARPELQVPPQVSPDGLPQNDPLLKADADRVVATAKEAQTWAGMMPLFDAIEKDMSLFPTGPTAGIELQGRSLGSIVSAGDPQILAAGERLDKNLNKLVSENMAFLKGAMSEGEREFTKKFSISMKSTVEGNRAYIGFLREVAKRAKAKAPMMREYYRANNNSLDGFDDAWNAYVKDNPIPIPEIGEGEDSGKVFKYNPATGGFD